jgi:hypothetical protein
MSKLDKQKSCPCCGQLASAETIEIAREEYVRSPMVADERSPAEDPEQAFRRGYHHGAFIVAEAIKGRINSALWRKIDAFVGCVERWRYNWRYHQRADPSRLKGYYRASAPEPSWLRAAGAACEPGQYRRAGSNSRCRSDAHSRTAAR